MKRLAQFCIFCFLVWINHAQLNLPTNPIGNVIQTVINMIVATDPSLYQTTPLALTTKIASNNTNSDSLSTPISNSDAKFPVVVTCKIFLRFLRFLSK